MASYTVTDTPKPWGCENYANGSENVAASWNVMTHAQKPDLVFRRNGRVHLNRPGASVQSTTGSRVVRFSGSNAGYTMFRGSVKGNGYPLHSPVSPSLPLPCVTVCHHVSTGVYLHCTTHLIVPFSKCWQTCTNGQTVKNLQPTFPKSRTC